MDKLSADQALAIEDRKGGGGGRCATASPPRTLAKPRYLFPSGTHIPKFNEMKYAFPATENLNGM